jgi:TrmH family RNA methyltransferase
MGAQLFVTDSYQHWSSRLPKTLLSEKQMARITDTKSPQGIIAIVPCSASHDVTQPLVMPISNKERTIYLHEIQDPGNLGTILRTLAWFGNFRCLISPESVDPYNPKVVRASMGAIFHVPIEVDVPLKELIHRYSRFACLDIQGKRVSNNKFSDYDCYIFGNEARGLPQAEIDQLKATTFSIQGAGNIESLNLATAVNICAYELNRDTMFN